RAGRRHGALRVVLLSAQSGRDVLRRLLFEEIAELVFAEARRARDEVNARELSRLSPLPRVEKYERAVGTPRDCVAAAVGEDADGLRAAVAFDLRDEDVAEEFPADGEVCNPTAVGRPHERAVGVERRSLKAPGRDDALLSGLHVERANLSPAALEREPFAVGRKARRVVAVLLVRQLRLRVRAEVVEEELPLAVALGDVCEASAVGCPGGLRLRC